MTGVIKPDLYALSNFRLFPENSKSRAIPGILTDLTETLDESSGYKGHKINQVNRNLVKNINKIPVYIIVSQI